jgi:hypothetical protein
MKAQNLFYLSKMAWKKISKSLKIISEERIMKYGQL